MRRPAIPALSSPTSSTCRYSREEGGAERHPQRPEPRQRRRLGSIRSRSVPSSPEHCTTMTWYYRWHISFKCTPTCTSNIRACREPSSFASLRMTASRLSVRFEEVQHPRKVRLNHAAVIAARYLDVLHVHIQRLHPRNHGA